MSSSHESRAVVVKNDLLRKLPSVLVLLLFDLAFVWGDVMAIAKHDAGWAIRSSMHPGLRGEIIWWVIIGPIQLGFLYGTVFLFRMRQVYSSAGIEVRKVLATHRIDVADMTEIVFRDATIHTGQFLTEVIPRMLIKSTSGRQGFLQPWLLNVRPALEVVDGWVRQRPELVGDGDVQQWYVARGVLAERSDER